MGDELLLMICRLHSKNSVLDFHNEHRILMAKTSKTMLNSSGESGHPCLVPDFRGNAFNFSPLRIMFAVDLSYMTCLLFLRMIFH